MRTETSWPCHPGAAMHRGPATAVEALSLLARGSASFASFTAGEAQDVPNAAWDRGSGVMVASERPPFAAIVACADALVPLEAAFSVSVTDLFTIRVAGNVLGADSLGSVDYALAQAPTVRLLAVIGHTGCDAVGGAVDAYLAPSSYLEAAANLPLRAIVDAILAAVRGADTVLRSQYGDAVAEAPGYRAALVDTTAVVNAALAASALRHQYDAELGETLGVAFGLYDGGSRVVGLPLRDMGPAWSAGLVVPPVGDAFAELIRVVVASSHVGYLLDTAVAC